MKNSVIAKTTLVGLMMLFLLIPTTFIAVLISGREQRRNEAVGDIQSSWSGPQIVNGPLLNIPVRVSAKDDKGRITWTTVNVLVLPDALDVGGEIATEPRYRGIYQTVVYASKLSLAGSFSVPDFARLGLKGGVVQWDQATVSVGLSDLRGVKDASALEWAGRPLALDAGAGPAGVQQALTAAVPPGSLSLTAKGIPFSLAINLKGSQTLYFVPVGKTTTVALKSAWPSPAFKGTFLPDERTVSASGFDAHWKILHINRNLPQVSTENSVDFNSPAFGVELMIPVDQYASAERAVKYEILFVFFTFLAFFFIEHFQTKRLHPIQYLLVGAGVVLFYLLLLSFSEQMPFPLAYALSSAAIVAVIGGYSHAVFGRAPITSAVVAILSGLYAYLYTLLRLEDYALLLGSLGLLAALALVMYLTRRFDWYEVEAAPASK
jgi:inner membrane protein